ncbi:MAG: sodium:proton antiporter NhaD [Dysgonamonadaceae bacterium]|jgi:Na+/H+ antiporter NhaD/arsenite permease-like protein|nr:sodium:proton antiporter NhaD [Dysgonamonadaceae bacterium]
MFYIVIIVFILGYTCIAFEHPIHINKSATALLLGAILWVLLILGDPASMPVFNDFQAYLSAHPDANFASWITHDPLLHHLGEVAEILFFLLGAMTIVEIVDSHEGFRLITDKITTTKKTTLLWIIGILTFFMSAVLDNLTTSIVMIALLRKIISDQKERWFYAGMVILAANAGGAWSPIGDVTTIMLWIGAKITADRIIFMTFLPSLISIIVPLLILSFTMKGNIQHPGTKSTNGTEFKVPNPLRNFIFFLGVGALLFVPVFKTITHLPPYIGMLGGLGVLWMTTEIIHHRMQLTEAAGSRLSVASILRRVDTPSILFFLGILLAVAALQTYGHLGMLSESLDTIPIAEPGKYYLITTLIGVLSSVVDNVPLVAGAMGMYTFPVNHYFWEFLAYTAGTGGSILIIGSAAGVAVMGMEKIDFIWYFKKISLLALVGYLSGCAVYILQQLFIFH